MSVIQVTVVKEGTIIGEEKVVREVVNEGDTLAIDLTLFGIDGRVLMISVEKEENNE